MVVEVELDTKRARNQYGNFGNDIVNDLGKVDQASKKTSLSITSIAKAIGLVKVAGVAFNVLKNSIEGAVARFDTLEKFPKVMQSMGFETEQSGRAMERMSNSIEGLPTTLNDMVSLTQKFVNITGNLDKSVDTAEALNNAMLASGSSSADAARGIEQYAQMLGNGEPDMQSFKSINETMGYGLKRVAEEMVGTGSNAMDLYAKLKSGEITMDEMNDKIIELGGATGELATLARENSEGIGTSFANLQNAAVKGLANVIKKLDDLSKKTTNNSIAKNIDKMKVIVNNSFKAMGTAIDKSEPFVRLFMGSLKLTYSTAKSLTPIIYGLATAYAALKIVKTVSAFHEKHIDLLARAVDSGKKLELVTKNQMAAEVSKIGIQKAGMAATAANNGLVKASTVLYGLFTGALTVGEVSAMGMTAAMGLLNTAMNAMLAHPLITTLAILAATIGLVVKVSKSMNKETIDARKETEAYTETVKENAKQTKDNIRARRDKIDSMDKEVAMSKSLVDRLEVLTQTEKASTDGKKEIKEGIQELNRLYPELNLQYDDNTNKVNQNAAAIKSQIEAYTSYDKVSAIQENLKTVTEEMNSAQAEGIIISEKINATQADKEDWYKRNLIQIMETNKSEKALIEQQEANGERQEALSKEYQMYLEQQAAARDAALAAQKSAIQEAGLQYDFLSDSQKELVDTMKEQYQEILGATNSFTNDLSFELDMTGQEFIDFVAKNHEVMNQWGDNLQTLTSRGANEGFIKELQSMGPEGAKFAQIAVNMTDEEFNKMNSLFAESSKISAETWKKVYGQENIDPAITELVTEGDVSLSAALANSGINELLNEQGKKGSDSLLEGFEIDKEAVGLKGREFVDSILPEEAAASLRTSAVDVGASLPQGMEEGINQNGDLAEQAAKQMAIDTLTASKVALDSHSPSRKFVQVGADVVNGLVLGITQGNGKVQAAANQMATTLLNSMKTINSASNVSMTGFVSSITSSMSRANGVVQSQTNLMRNTFNNFDRSIGTQNTASMASYNNVLNAGMSKSTSTVQRNTNQMRTLFTSMRTMIASQSTAAMNTMVNAFNSGSGRAVSSVNSTRSRMASSMSGLRGSFYNSGVNASYGLASGINAGSGVAMAAAYNLAARITATLRNAMKIKSPSRVMRDEIGRYIPQGIAVGIDKDAHYVDKSLEDIADSMAKPFNLSNLKKFVPNINGLMSGNLTPELAFGLDKQLVSGKQAISQISNSSEKIVIENQPQVVMHVTWNGKEDIRSSMEKMGYIVNIDERGALGTWHTT